MVLTENKIICEGHVLKQVKRLNTNTFTEEYGGYIEPKLFHKYKSSIKWIGLNTKVYGTVVIRGRAYFDADSIIKHTTLIGAFFIGKKCTIINSNLSTFAGCIRIDNNCNVINKTFAGSGKYTPELFQEKNFCYKHHNGIHLILTEHYCRVGCLTLTYDQARNILFNDVTWNKLKIKKFKDNPTIFSTEGREWLINEYKNIK